VQDRLAGEVKPPDGTTVGPKPKAWNGKNAQSAFDFDDALLQLADPGLELLDELTECAILGLIAVEGPHFANPLHRRQLAKRVQLIEGVMARLDHPCNDIVAPETDGPLELQEDLCSCEHRRPSQPTTIATMTAAVPGPPTTP
jgi:hypothetical protein